ncbi:MAG: hypothetical protein R3C25_14580, partial [Hyphomonadaceae bacterium]
AAPALGIEAAAPFTGAIALDAPARLLAAQVRDWARVAVVEEERTRRAATARAHALSAPAPAAPRPLRALYVGAPSAVFLELERMFTGHNAAITAAFTSHAGLEHLHDETFDAVILNGAQDKATAVTLCGALRRNASLYHLPTMMITAPGDAATAEAALSRGASSVADAGAPCGPSLGWLFEAIRRERRRYSAEHDARAFRDIMGDARTGLWRREPFEAHLARLASDHHASGRPLSVAVLRVLPAHGARQPGADVWRRGFGEISSLAARLMRDADSGAAFGADIIAVALPASQLKAAKRAAERIAAVAECTAFAAGDNTPGPLVFEQSAAELQPGESGAGLLSRALRAIEVESIPA